MPVTRVKRSATPKPTRAATAAHEPLQPTVMAPGPGTREAMIRIVAYALYERRGRVGGRELEDWLEAEQEVDRRLAGAPDPAAAG